MMIKCIIVLVIIFIVILLLRDDSCENYSGLDIQGDAIPCYEAIKYNNLDKSRVYNANDVNYDNAGNEEGYNFSSENVPLSNSVIPMPSM
jgi:hypothetical protein